MKKIILQIYAGKKKKKNLQLLEFAFVANPANFVTRQCGGQVLEITRHLLNQPAFVGYSHVILIPGCHVVKNGSACCIICPFIPPILFFVDILVKIKKKKIGTSIEELASTSICCSYIMQKTRLYCMKIKNKSHTSLSCSCCEILLILAFLSALTVEKQQSTH